MDYIIVDGELYHYGVKGMKWGIRRTAAQLGHKVASGAKKVATAAKEAHAKRKEVKKTQKAASKPLSEMSNEELRAMKERLQLQKDVLTLKSDISRLSPQKVSKGKKFMEKFVSPTADKLLKDVGIPLVEKELKKRLGLEKTDEFDALTKSHKKAKLEWEQRNYENKLRDDDAAKAKKAEKETKSNSSEFVPKEPKLKDFTPKEPTFKNYDPDDLKPRGFKPDSSEKKSKSRTTPDIIDVDARVIEDGRTFLKLLE